MGIKMHGRVYHGNELMHELERVRMRDIVEAIICRLVGHTWRWELRSIEYGRAPHKSRVERSCTRCGASEWFTLNWTEQTARFEHEE